MSNYYGNYNQYLGAQRCCNLKTQGPASPFTTAGNGVAWNNAEGYVNMTSPITLNKYGSGLSNKIDVVSDSYYNQGLTNFSLSISSS